MGQRPIKLMDDEDVPTVNMLTPNNNYRLAISRVKSVEDPLAFAVIPGSMSLLRPASASRISPQPSARR